MTRIHRLLLSVVLVCLSLTAWGLSPEGFRQGERVVFFGDSITHGGSYIFYTQLFWDLRYPGSGTVMMNGGISGDSAGGALNRWEHDILPMKPDRAFVMFGMNDVGRHNYASQTPSKAEAAGRQRSLTWYEGNQRKLAAKIRKAGVELELVTPSPYDQYGAKPKAVNLVACNDPGLRACADIVRKLAAENQVGVVEFHRPMTELLKAHPEAMLCGGDRVHPQNVGHLLMAALILQSLEQPESGHPVASACLELAGGTVTNRQCQHCRIDQARGAKDGITFRYQPERLPFPALKEYVALEKIYPPVAQLNREIIRVTGLSVGDYRLRVAGRELGRFTADQLKQGVNIALLDTPNQRQAQEAAKVMYALRTLESNLRNVPYMNITLMRRKVDLKDHNACFRSLDTWLEELEARKSSALNYFRWVVKSYKKLRPQEKQLREKTLSLRRQLRDCCVPQAYQIELSRVRP